ncbi:DEAD/DEAH-box helicase [Rhizoctonia solani AG-3 Rhs1AP]|uniref:DNA 3'-5' helicase n=2 Tax=Rhizoctonia solani AG-3 TaxID=1086053 RepID=A0A074SK65_9AGAM|nr:DEAD/DEAH-box helicase [Rhizoctonia solani AG-3 Rhs1AP]KEP50437.1 DEAD/DEAH-box helicase [Rhizoctonia solani 123E]
MAMLSVPREWSLGQIRQHLKSIAREKFTYGLKGWQDLGAAKLLKGQDVMLLIATGEGKSTVFQLYALARPKDIILVVSPLKMLEENMVENLGNKGFKAVALNPDTISAAKQEGRNLWRECGDGQHQIMFASPELLASKEMDTLLSKRRFQSLLGLIVVDEVHLIPVWGVDFRRAFLAIGSLRSRVLPTTVFLALTATLVPGTAQRMVERTLGLAGERYFLLKRDCARDNLFINLRRIDHSISSAEFKDLDWLLTGSDIRSTEGLKQIPKTIVYTNTVLQGYRATRYLQSRLPSIPDPERAIAIRHLHATTCPDCKQDILTEFTRPAAEGKLRIVFATDAFGCGIDIPDIDRVVNLGTPTTADNGVQRIGRAGRGLEMGEAYIYVGSRLWDATKKQIEAGTPVDNRIRCCEHFQRLLEAHHRGECINKEIATIYGDKIDLEDFSSCGQCSGCVPEATHRSTQSSAPKRKRGPKPVPLVRKAPQRGPGRLTTEIIKQTREELLSLVMDLWLSTPVCQNSHFNGVDAFIPDEKVTLLHKYLRDLDTIDQIRQLLLGWEFWNTHGARLALGVLGIRAKMINQLEATVRKKAEGRRSMQEQLPSPDTDESSDTNSELESLYESESDAAPGEETQSK